MKLIKRDPEFIDPIGLVEESPLVAELNKALDADPENPQRYLDLGFQLCEESLFREGLEVYSKGLELFPDNAMLYRARAEQYLNCWQLYECQADSVKATAMLPKDWNSWYHYAVSSYYLQEYKKCEELSRYLISVCEDEDSKIPPLCWLYRSLMMQGRKDEANKAIEIFYEGMDHIDWHDDYYDCLRLYRGWVKPEELLDKCYRQFPIRDWKTSVYSYTVFYGVANWYYLNGDVEKYRELREQEIEFRFNFPRAFAYCGCLYEKALGM